LVHVGLGEVDRALDYLEQAYRVRDPFLFHVPFVPLYGPLDADPRFHGILDRVPMKSSPRRPRASAE
jgi:hypothetical protein